MPANVDFFKEPQPAAVLKHGILSRYVVIFASKTGSQSKGNVVFLDGYAGPGRYESGEPASPMLAIDLARKLSSYRNLRCVFVELNKAYYEQLEELIQTAATDLNVRALLGNVEDHIHDIVTACGDDPLFAYLDPFGVGIPFETMTDVLLGRSRFGHPKTEVLLNFSIQALERMGGMLTSQARNREATLERLDSTLGGDWWRPLYLGHTGADRLHLIVKGYRDRLSAATGGWGGWTVPVFDKIGGRPEYLLLHFTQHEDGHWQFHQQLSKAREEWRAAARAAFPSEADRLAQLGQLPLEGLEPEASFEEDEGAWIDEIEANVLNLVHAGVPAEVQDNMDAVFGRALGLGRETHLRKALKRVEATGVLANTVKGELQHYVIAPAVTPPTGLQS